ncbi:MAG TPA: O-antigen ligase family protein [Acidimicrobiales bacterium]|nr:O-antigen ligase family protein [Acidimicrobiales bacterium]
MWPPRCALTETATAVAPAAPSESLRHDSDPAGGPADSLGLLAVVGAGLLPVVFSGELYYSAWAPKAAVCLLLLGPGLVVLARLALAGDLAARLALGFVAAAALSTLLSDNVVLSLVGSANWGTGLLFAATLGGCWALGAVAGERRRRQLVLAIIAAAVVNAVVAWLQTRGLVPPALEDPRATTAGRTGGLLGNPVHLGALMAGALWLLGRRVGRERGSWWWLLPIGLVAGAAQLSGGRSAVALALVAALACLPGAGARRGVALMAAVAFGVVLAPLGVEGAVLGSARAARPAPTPASADEVSAPVARETDTRLAVWRTSAGAFTDRPLLGWGPGRFQAATSPRYDAESAREGGVFQDAHNWLVEYGITTGLVGLVLLLAWLGTAAVGARGALAGFVLIVGGAGLVEPLTVGLTPVALLALGAAGRPRGAGIRHAPALGGAWASTAAGALAAGAMAGTVLLVGQGFMGHARLNDSPGQARWAMTLSPPWPEVAGLAARVESFYGVTEGEPHRSRTVELARRATRRDPADPAAWSYLGFLELVWGDEGRAATAFGHSLDQNPWGAEGLRGSVALAVRRGDQTALAESCRLLRILHRAPPACSSVMERSVQ